MIRHCKAILSQAFCFQVGLLNLTVVLVLVFLNLTVVERTSAMTAPTQHSTDATTMNKTSVKFASWVLRVTHGHSYDYTFTAKKTGKEVRSHKFEIRLSGKSGKAYVLAVLKGTEGEVKAAEAKFKNGSIWEVSNVNFEENVTPAFISSAHKVSVDLKKSNLLLSTDAALDNELAKAAVPPRTVAETSKITSTRHQDLLAIVTAIEPIRTTKRGNALDITVMDASEDSAGNYAKVVVTVWGDTKQQMVAIGKPLVFST